MRRYVIPCLVLLAVPVLAQGGLEVKILSAKIVPNPRPDLSRDYKGKEVLQLEVLGTDRSGATSIESRQKDIALYDCNGQQAARLLYALDSSTHHFPDEVRREIRTSLIFSAPEGAKQQYSLRWAVTRYAKHVTEFTWTGEDLKLPLEQERDGITVSLDGLKLGHESAEEIAGHELQPDKAAKMAAEHLILSLRCFGLRHEATKVMWLDDIEVSTSADRKVRNLDPRVDFVTTNYSDYSVEKMYRMTATSVCHFLDTTAIPKITRITLKVGREVPFDEGWTPVEF
jgi:hypothetical protein